MRQIVLDTGTTGLSADRGDRIIEIGCVELLNRKLTGNNWHVYINPERDSHEDALRIHGISNEFLKTKPKFAEVVDDFLAFVTGAELIIHNARFDIGFLSKELERLSQPPMTEVVTGVVDTIKMAKDLFPGKRSGLDALCDRLGVDNSNRTLHGALLDAQLLAEVYVAMTRGQDALIDDELLAQASPGQSQNDTISAIDLSQSRFIVLQPSAQELTAHTDLLADIAKASKSQPVWPV